MGRITGIEPARVGATIRCVNHFAIYAKYYCTTYAQLVLYQNNFICKEQILIFLKNNSKIEKVGNFR